MAVSVVKNLKGIGSQDMEIHHVTWGAGSDLTHDLPTDLSEIYLAIPISASASNDGHDADDIGIVEIDEGYDSDGVMTPDSSGNVTIERHVNGAGTAAGQHSTVVLFGKSGV